MAENNELLGQLIAYAAQMDATDLHVSPGMVPDVVVHGRLLALVDAPVVSAEAIMGWLTAYCPTTSGALSGPDGAADGAVTLGQVRVRLAFRRQRGGVALTARLLPVKVPTLAELTVPNAVADLIHRSAGLVVVAGPTGAGKSTLMAALVNELNWHESKHIMTIEEPVEYTHPQGKCRISQREVGLDVGSFGAALRAALRSRPDIVVVGEMRDAETARAALEAATKGQLVLTTSHASSATDALEGMIALFPGDEQAAAAGRVASTLQAVVVQRLVPNLTDTGVVAVRELLLRTDGIAALIRGAQFSQLYNAMQATPENPGMFRLEDDLAMQVTDQVITVETAVRAANRRDHLAALLGQFAARKGGAR